MKDTITLPRRLVEQCMVACSTNGWLVAESALQAALNAPVEAPPPQNLEYIAQLKATSVILRSLDEPVTFNATKIAIADAIDALLLAVKVPTPEPQPDKGCMTCKHGDSDGFPACLARGAACYMSADGHGSNWEPLNSDSKPPQSVLHTTYMVGLNKGKQDALKEPRRVPLTDEWIRGMCQQTWVFETVKQWVKAIEAAHGIKEGS